MEQVVIVIILIIFSYITPYIFGHASEPFIVKLGNSIIILLVFAYLGWMQARGGDEVPLTR